MDLEFGQKQLLLTNLSKIKNKLKQFDERLFLMLCFNFANMILNIKKVKKEKFIVLYLDILPVKNPTDTPWSALLSGVKKILGSKTPEKQDDTSQKDINFEDLSFECEKFRFVMKKLFKEMEIFEPYLKIVWIDKKQDWELYGNGTNEYDLVIYPEYDEKCQSSDINTIKKTIDKTKSYEISLMKEHRKIAKKNFYTGLYMVELSNIFLKYQKNNSIHVPGLIYSPGFNGALPHVIIIHTLLLGLLICYERVKLIEHHDQIKAQESNT